MNNKNVSDFVAATMDAVLNSQEHKSLFGTTYKFASDENDAKTCNKCHSKIFFGKCKCDKKDESKADDNDVTSCSSDTGSNDYSMADDLTVDENDAYSSSSGSSSDSSSADDENAAYDVAIDSLITASAALDSLGLERGASVSLKLASLIVEAKKTSSDSKKKDKKKNSGKKDSGKKDSSKKTDTNSAKDKKTPASSSKKPSSSTSSSSKKGK